MSQLFIPLSPLSLSRSLSFSSLCFQASWTMASFIVLVLIHVSGPSSVCATSFSSTVPLGVSMRWSNMFTWTSSLRYKCMETCAGKPHPLSLVELYYMRMFTWVSNLLEFIITHKPNIIWKWSLHQSASLAELHKGRKPHGCKSLVTNLSIVRHTLGTLTPK